MSLKGTRLPDAEMGVPGPGWDAWASSSGNLIWCPLGSYMKVTDRDHPAWTCWYVKDPAGKIGTISLQPWRDKEGNMQQGHVVTEHPDGTISVTPSLWDKPNGWHGYLTNGVWTSV